jgi:hypothetical protein
VRVNVGVAVGRGVRVGVAVDVGVCVEVGARVGCSRVGRFVAVAIASGMSSGGGVAVSLPAQAAQMASITVTHSMRIT